MKKIGICCCYRNHNFGSQLQSYATTVELARRGVAFEVIHYKKKFTPVFIWKGICSLFNPVFISDKLPELKKKILLEIHRDEKKNVAIRDQKFRDFAAARFPNLSPFCHGYQELKALGGTYAGVMVGSDQLWSPGGIIGNFHNLMFVPDHVHKFSYAASFGVPEIPRSKRRLYKTFLSRVEHISVRENAGQKIVRDMIGREVPVVADPVILLTPAQWDAEIPAKRPVEEPYIFAYLLGDSVQTRQQVLQLQQLTGLKIVAFHHMDSYNKADIGFGDIVPYDVGPEEFLNYIRFADYICTDSFHGSVFSSLYHKKFMVFSRYSDQSRVSKNSRIDSLCENLGLTGRRYTGSNIEDIFQDIDYEQVDIKISRIRDRSRAFLDQALAFYDARP